MCAIMQVRPRYRSFLGHQIRRLPQLTPCYVNESARVLMQALKKCSSEIHQMERGCSCDWMKRALAQYVFYSSFMAGAEEVLLLILYCAFFFHQHSFRMPTSVRNSPATLWYMKASPVVGLTRKLSPLGEALLSVWSKQPTTTIMAIPLDEALLYCVAFGSLLFGTVLKPCIASRHF